MRYREAAQKLRRVGCTEQPRRGGGSHRRWLNPATGQLATLPNWGTKDLKLRRLKFPQAGRPGGPVPIAQQGCRVGVGPLFFYGWASGAGETTNQWVKLELPHGRLHTVRAVVIDPAATHGQDAANDLKDFEIRVSTTSSADADFTMVFRGTVEQRDILQRFDLPQPMQAKYLELVGLTNYGGADGIDVAELEIVADEQVLAPPPRVHHLTGMWNDGSRRVRLTQRGDTVEAHYIKPYPYAGQSERFGLRLGIGW